MAQNLTGAVRQIEGLRDKFGYEVLVKALLMFDSGTDEESVIDEMYDRWDESGESSFMSSTFYDSFGEGYE